MTKVMQKKTFRFSINYKTLIDFYQDILFPSCESIVTQNPEMFLLHNLCRLWYCLHNLCLNIHKCYFVQHHAGLPAG